MWGAHSEALHRSLQSAAWLPRTCATPNVDPSCGPLGRDDVAALVTAGTDMHPSFRPAPGRSAGAFLLVRGAAVSGFERAEDNT
mmetsp:Transcript_41151/g.108127  ORF Transcript_41151/g.108127 Transcript_41151/m.108127 type:complete len:84 (+) Transcript_41151:117-368(+)